MEFDATATQPVYTYPDGLVSPPLKIDQPVFKESSSPMEIREKGYLRSPLFEPGIVPCAQVHPRVLVESLWADIREEALREIKQEPLLKNMFRAMILERKDLEDAVGFILSRLLAGPFFPVSEIKKLFDDAFADDQRIALACCLDIQSIVERDPAAESRFQPLLYFKGFHALQSYRLCHWLWKQGRHTLAFVLQSRISESFGVDIHPAARIGAGLLIDHATSVVIGETAVVEDDVSILHEVTLGGTGKDSGDRHPKVRRGVLIGAGAKILGNVEIGKGAKVGAGSVVLGDVPAHSTVVGIPAEIVGAPEVEAPALEMNHRLARDRLHQSARS